MTDRPTADDLQDAIDTADSLLTWAKQNHHWEVVVHAESAKHSLQHALAALQRLPDDPE